jgi:hypothetical protein
MSDFRVVEHRPLLTDSSQPVATFYLIENRGTRYEIILVHDVSKGDILVMPNAGFGSAAGPCMKLPDYWRRDPKSLSLGYLEEKLGLGEGDLEAVQLFLQHVAWKPPAKEQR